MRWHKWSAPCVVALVMLCSRTSLAECTKDVECKGDRICVDGACVDPPPAAGSGFDLGLGPSNAGTVAAPPPTATTPTTSEAPRMERRSQGLFVGGIVSLSLVPIALIVSAYSSFQQSSCRFEAEQPTTPVGRAPDCSRFNATIYGGAIAGVALLGGGLAMLLVGVQKVPVAKQSTASIRPWVSPGTAGVGLETTF